ncbi:[protein-PII] uridylyltransferase [Salidesulfovibrio onnuriiensis]|uniref:[protein-PII] uridylyltransferase n=1 Tax=Salidesulfovibrio onnuriiensis TaxID=2583823 RepID=UPI00164F0207|nr:[protein-PII] uridylyltransferase [Salidesulfovibrio onnuriiensis]
MNGPATAANATQTYARARKRLLDGRRAGGLQGLPGALAHATDVYFTDRLGELGHGHDLEGVPYVLAAVGGYGRSELCPGSDIDLLLLFESRIPEQARDFIRDIVYPLWDLRLDVGHGVRTVADCVSLSREDGKVLSSLLDARPLAGDAAVLGTFTKTFRDKVLHRHTGSFAAWLRGHNLEREARYGDSGGLLEPELKNGLGGLRDAHQVMWLSAVQGRTGTSPFLPHELARLREDVRFLLRVRTALHLQARRKMDRLVFDLQPNIAETLGFLPSEHSPESAGRAVEFFLSRLHRAMNRILAMREALFREVYPDSKTVAHHDNDPATNVECGASGLRFIRPDRVRAEHVLGIFLRWARQGVPLSWQARRFVAENRDRFGAELADRPEALDMLLDIFMAGHGAAASRGLAQTGLLAAIIPEFGQVRHLVQFNDFHVHPVGRHTLECIAMIAGLLEKGGEGDEDGWAGDMARMLEHPQRLVLAAFFHDLGKLENDHCAAGAELAESVLGRFNRPEDEIREVAFLVRHHLLIPETATRRDLSDENVIARVAARAGSTNRLDMLYLLSVADSRATGPRAWNNWTASLFSELYAKARSYMTHGELAEPLRAEKLMNTWDRVRELTDGRHPAPWVERTLEAMPPRALFALDAETLVRHMDLCAELLAAVREDRMRKPSPMGGKGVNVLDARPAKAGGCFEVTIAALDRPGLFATLAGALALHNLDILSADIFTWADGIAMDVFTVAEPEGALVLDEVWARVRRSIMYALTGKLDIESRLEDKRNSLLAPRRSAPKLPPSVNIENRSSDFHTVIEVAAPDRQGLLHDLALTLNRQGLSVELARITTIGGQAADVFHVLDREGMKLTDSERIESVRQALFDRVAA